MEPAQAKGLLSNPLDLRQIFFTNLQLLGFDAGAASKKWRTVYNKDMFALPNKQAFEVVMHFLFSRLNYTRCRDEFRECWPVTDKKQEQQFRKTCNNWLTEIAKDEPQVRLPRIVASLFMSPGGDKFYRLLFDFSVYVIMKVAHNEYGMKSSMCLQMPRLTKASSQFTEAMHRSVMCAAVRNRQRFLNHAECVINAHNQWKIYCSELIRDERSLNREVKELERTLKKEVERVAELQASRGSPAVSRRRSGMSSYEFDVQSVRRAERVREVRNLWKELTEFSRIQQTEQEIVESILSGEQEKSQLDATELNVRVPDLLLRECEKEIHRRNVDNIYQGGKLNILSLIHLWNLSLHLYIEKLHQVGNPKFVEAESMVRTHVHTHQAHLTNTEALRRQLGKTMLPDLKSNIASLKKELESMRLNASPSSVRNTLVYLDVDWLKKYHHAPVTPRRTLGLGLLPPTPPVNFNYDDMNLHHDPVSQHMSHTRDPSQQVSTPEAATQLMDLIHQKARSHQTSGLVQGSPLYAPRLANQGQPSGVNCLPTTKIPKRGATSKGGSRQQRTRIHSAPVHQTDLDDDDQENVEPSSSEVGSAHGTASSKWKKPVGSRTQKSEFKEPQSIARKSKTRQASGSGTQIKRHVSKGSKQAGAERAGPTPKRDQVQDILSETPPHIALGEDAFTSRDMLARTPQSQKPRGNPASWTEKLLNDSIGPLSSTRIEHYSKLRPQNADKLATRLFSDEVSDADTLKGSEAGESFYSQPVTSISGVASLNSTLRNEAVSRTSSQESNTEVNTSDQQAEQLVDRILSLSDMCEQDGSLTDMSVQQSGDSPSVRHSNERNQLNNAHQGHQAGSRISADVQKLTSDIAHDLLKWEEEPVAQFSLGNSLGDIMNTDDILRDLEATQTPTLPTRTTTLRDSSSLKSSPNRTKRVLLSNAQNDSITDGQNELVTSQQSQFKGLAQPIGRLGTYGQEKEQSPSFVDTHKTDQGHQSDLNQFPADLNEAVYQDDLDVLDLDEIDDELNTSARIIEVQNGNYSEVPEASPPRPKPSNSFVNSNNSASPSHVKSAPQTESNSRVVSDFDELMERYRRLKQGLSSSKDLNGGDGATSILESMHKSVETRERTPSPVIAEEYLTRTPVKETAKKFTLNFDDEDDQVMSTASTTTISDAYSPPHITSDERFLDSITPPFTPAAKHLGSTITSLQSVPLSPLTDALHKDQSMSQHNVFNLLDEDESILLPASPSNHNYQLPQNVHQSPAVGQLLDI